MKTYTKNRVLVFLGVLLSVLQGCSGIGDERVIGVAAAGTQTCARVESGKVLCWGRGEALGIGEDYRARDEVRAPVRVEGLDGVTHMAIGIEHACAINEDSELYCWGSLIRGVDDTGFFRTLKKVHQVTPERVDGTGKPQAVAVGLNATCILKAEGKVACWGGGGNGRLGGLRKLYEPDPVEVPNVKDIVGVESYAHRSCAIQRGGQIICWGIAEYQQLVTGVARELPVMTMDELREDPNRLLRASTDRWGPVIIPGVSAKQLSMGLNTTCAVQLDGTVACWQPATRYRGAYRAPHVIPGLDSMIEVAVGNEKACALSQDGDVWCWPLNAPETHAPVKVDGLPNATAIAMGGDHVCAITEAGQLMCWGSNRHGELGIGSSAKRIDSPQRVTGFRS